jgi:hypothetical protein
MRVVWVVVFEANVNPPLLRGLHFQMHPLLQRGNRWKPGNLNLFNTLRVSILAGNPGNGNGKLLILLAFPFPFPWKPPVSGNAGNGFLIPGRGWPVNRYRYTDIAMITLV